MYPHTASRFALLTALCLLLSILPLSATLAQDGPTATTTLNLRVRSGPGTDYSRIGVIPALTSTILEGRSADSGWALVHTSDGALRGWVAASYLDAESPIDTLPVSDERLPSQESRVMERVRATPIVAQTTATARAIFQRGLARGNHPNRFSKVGDCQSIPEFFLGPFDRGDYDLGDFGYLQDTIDYFAGSFSRSSLAVWSGFTVYAILDPTWADPAFCNSGESPQECEYRLYQPSFVIISLEVWHGKTEDYAYNLRAVLDFWIENDVVPILATKADNKEVDWSVNAAIASIAWEYDIPLWNFLMATQPLPEYGLSDGFHLTFAQNHFGDAAMMQNAWPWRNLTALQSLDTVRRGVGAG